MDLLSVPLGAAVEGLTTAFETRLRARIWPSQSGSSLEPEGPSDPGALHSAPMNLEESELAPGRYTSEYP